MEEAFNLEVEYSNPSVLLVDSGLVECADGSHGVRPFWRHRNADLGSGFRAREHYLGVVIESIGVSADTGAPTVPNYLDAEGPRRWQPFGSPRLHSARRATAGSVRLARAAGTNAATAPAPRRMLAAGTNDAGSVGATSKRKLARTRETAR